MRIKEVSRRTGLTEKAIRYYESRGLVLPIKEERNGRLWREYTEEHIQILEAVAILRKAFFHVEEINTIIERPEDIPNILAEVSQRVEETHATLALLQDKLQRQEVQSAPNLLGLAAELKEVANPLNLPVQDLKFNFRIMDRLLVDEKRAIEETPTHPLSFGWREVYRGTDRAKFQDIKERLELFGIESRIYVYPRETRLAARKVSPSAIPALMNKNGGVLQALEIKLVKNSGEDCFAIEVRKRDVEKVQKALRRIRYK